MDRPESIVEVLDRYGSYPTTTKGTSMQPLFRTRRDVVILERPVGEVKKYDVVLYNAPYGNNIMHRVIKVLPDEYLIRGDNTFTDEHIPKGDIIAVMVSFNRKGKRYKVSSLSYRIYSVVWTAIYPIRRIIFKLRGFILRTGSKIKRRLFVRPNGEKNER